MSIHSIKWRLQLWHGSLLVLLVAGLMTGFYTYTRREKVQAIDAQLNDALTSLLPRYAPPRDGGPGEHPRRPPRDRPEDVPPPDERPGRVPELSEDRSLAGRGYNSERIYFVVWTEDGSLLTSSTNAPTPVEFSLRSRTGPGREYRTHGNFRELEHFVPTGRRLLVGTSLEATTTALHQLAATLVVLGLSIVAVGLTVGGWLVARSLRPILEISAAAQKIAAGDLSKRINAEESESELGQLTTVLNSTFARLDSAFSQQQQFTSDAAHELRTPVSVILTQVQSTLNKERSGAEYRETLEACQRAAQRMRRLIESLLELARFDAGQEQIKRVPFDLAAKARECIDLLQPLAAERQVKLVADLAEASCSGDSERLSQVIVNLLTNAISYNKTDGEVRITTNVQNGIVILTVADTGNGIASADAPHVFERFYRADKARAGSSGKAGLGLAICKSIVAAHDGTIDFTSEPGRGTTFTLHLPTS